MSRVLRAFFGIITGVGLGVVCYAFFDYGAWSFFGGAVGAFIGAALAQPDVSTGNVLMGTAGVIVARNAPGFMRQDILDATFGETPEGPENGPSADPPHSPPTESGATPERRGG